MFIAIFEEFLIVIIFKIAEICSKLPFSKIYLATPDFWMVIVYYIVISVIVYLFNINKIKFLKFILGNGISEVFSKNARKIVSSIIIIVFIFGVTNFVSRDLRIYFVDVGQRRLYCYQKSNGKKYYY